MKCKALMPALGALLLTLAGCQSPLPNPPSHMTPATDIIIDVRTQKEFADGHLEGALHMPYDAIHELISQRIPRKDTRILLYCRSGNRSGKALKTLQEMGYTNAANIGAMPDAAETTGRTIVK